SLRVDPDPPLQQHAQAGTGVGVQVRDSPGRKVDAVAAHDPIALRPLRQLPLERVPLDVRRAVLRLVALDVVHDAVAVLRRDAVRVIGEPQDQWNVWPPSITIVCPVTKSEPGPQKYVTAPTTSSGTWSRWIVRAAIETSRS